MRGRGLLATVAGACVVALAACGGAETAEVEAPGGGADGGGADTAVVREAAGDVEVWDGTEFINGCAIKVGLDCPGAQLQYTDLSNLDLTGADFQEADLTGANLSGTNLSGANLVGAVLEGANLSGANLSGANLSQAWLVEANLTGADLSGVTFNETVMPDGTVQTS